MRKLICFFAFMTAILCSNLTATETFAGDKTKNNLPVERVVVSNPAIPSTTLSGHKTRDNFFPVVRLITETVMLCNDTAFSLLVEGGPRSYRFNGTLGFISDCNRFKISAEHLTQRLHYDFDSGKTHHWMHQLAIGGLYQYLIESPCYVDGFQLGLRYSNAPSKTISADQIAANEFNLRRIAGAWSWTAEAGVLVMPWECANFVGSITYDQVHYRRKYQDGKRVSGVGFCMDFSQRFYKNFLFDINFEYKQAYNNLGAAFRWTKEFECGDLDIGIFAYHVFGKRRLPCSTTAGIELGFAFGVSECSFVPISSCYDGYDCNPCAYDTCDLVAWVACPAVYMPQVLAISDQQLCTVPTISTAPNTFASQGVDGVPSITVDTAPYFVGGTQTLTYSAHGLPPGSSIDPVTGVITLVNTCGTFTSGNIFVTASDACGSSTGSFTYTLTGNCNPS